MFGLFRHKGSKLFAIVPVTDAPSNAIVEEATHESFYVYWDVDNLDHRVTVTSPDNVMSFLFMQRRLFMLLK